MICARCREQVDRNRRLRREKIRNGLCYQCGVEPHEVDRLKCTTCLEVQRVKQRQRRARLARLARMEVA